MGDPLRNLATALTTKVREQAEDIAQLVAALDVAHKWMRCIHPSKPDVLTLWQCELKQIEDALGDRRTAR